MFAAIVQSRSTVMLNSLFSYFCAAEKSFIRVNCNQRMSCVVMLRPVQLQVFK